MSLSPPPASEKRPLFRRDTTCDFGKTSSGVEKGSTEAPKDHRLAVKDADSPPCKEEPKKSEVKVKVGEDAKPTDSHTTKDQEENTKEHGTSAPIAPAALTSGHEDGGPIPSPAEVKDVRNQGIHPSSILFVMGTPKEIEQGFFDPTDTLSLGSPWETDGDSDQETEKDEHKLEGDKTKKPESEKAGGGNEKNPQSKADDKATAPRSEEKVTEEVKDIEPQKKALVLNTTEDEKTKGDDVIDASNNKDKKVG